MYPCSAQAGVKMAMSVFFRCQKVIEQLERRLFQVLGGHGPNGPWAPALAGCNDRSQSLVEDRDTVDSDLEKGIFWAVPKSRRSLQRRRTRRNGWTKILHWATPRQNIKECLVCGHWHLVHALCGNCYDKVRKETEEMRMTMAKDDRDYNAPLTEVAYIYKGEERNAETHGAKFVVEVDKPRPEWFSKFLLTKAIKRQ